jgi:hypothetical protein
MNHSKALVLVAIAATLAAACNRPLLDREKPAVERVSSTIPPSRFHVLATVAGGGSRTDLQISVTVRQRLADSGFTAVRRAGRWDNEADAVRSICAPGQTPAIDGVLFIWYNRLELRDCTTEGAAFEIGGEGASIGITAMTDRLVRWLKRDNAATAPSPSQ